MNDAALPTHLTERFHDAARDAGLIDVAYARADSPFGPLTLAASERGLLLCSYPEHSLDELLERICRKVSPRVLESPARLDDVRRQLDRYFAGEGDGFDARIDWSLTSPGFFRRVLQATNRIGFGHTRSYREVAKAAGNERAVRATGNGLGSNPIAIVVPCHRVLRTGGGLGGYTGGVERKQKLLELEGIAPR